MTQFWRRWAKQKQLAALYSKVDIRVFFYCIVYFEKASDEKLMTSNTTTMYGKQLGISRMRVLCSVATNVSREGGECPSFTFSLPSIVGEAKVEGIFGSYI